MLDRSPLVAAHRSGPRVGQEVDDDVLGMDVEQVVARVLERSLTVVDGRHTDRLDRMDAERLDDRLPALPGRNLNALASTAFRHPSGRGALHWPRVAEGFVSPLLLSRVYRFGHRPSRFRARESTEPTRGQERRGVPRRPQQTPRSIDSRVLPTRNL